jgi:hypothetical protein
MTFVIDKVVHGHGADMDVGVEAQCFAFAVLR